MRLHCLPPEVLELVTGALSARDLANLQRTCRTMRRDVVFHRSALAGYINIDALREMYTVHALRALPTREVRPPAPPSPPPCCTQGFSRWPSAYSTCLTAGYPKLLVSVELHRRHGRRPADRQRAGVHGVERNHALSAAGFDRPGYGTVRRPYTLYFQSGRELCETSIDYRYTDLCPVFCALFAAGCFAHVGFFSSHDAWCEGHLVLPRGYPFHELPKFKFCEPRPKDASNDDFKLTHGLFERTCSMDISPSTTIDHFILHLIVFIKERGVEAGPYAVPDALRHPTGWPAGISPHGVMASARKAACGRSLYAFMAGHQ